MKPSSHKSRNNKGRPSSSANPTERARKNRDRVANWSEEETSVLLDVVGELKLQRGMNNINFKDYTEIHEIFQLRLPNSTRSKEHCKTRVKHLKGQFSAAKHYTTLSGGYHWDYSTNMLSVSAEDLENIIQSNSQKLGFLRRPFPWFTKFNTLCGGSRADGNCETLFGERPDAANSGDASGSGSSDTPDVGGPVGGSIDLTLDEDPYPNAPYYDFNQEVQHDVQFNRDVGQQGSDSTMPTSRSSGSINHKSSDGAGPSVSRGKKIKDTLNVITQLFQSVADNDANTFALNQKLVTIFQGLLSVAERKLNKEDKDKDRCIERLDKMTEIEGELRVYIIERFTDPSARNVWIRGRDVDVYHWIARNFPQQFHRLRQQQEASQRFPNQQTNPPFYNNDAYMMNFVNQYQQPPHQFGPPPHQFRPPPHQFRPPPQ